MSQESIQAQQRPAEEEPSHHQRANRAARAALDLIRKWQLPAIPHFFEFCFVYVSGDNPSLTQAVGEALKDKGALDKGSVNALYARFVSAPDIYQRINTAGISLSNEISEVAEAIDAAVQATNSHSSDIDGAQNALLSIGQPTGIQSVATELAQSILNFRTINLELENRLVSSGREINDLQQNLKAIWREAQTDALTGLTNRKTFDLMIDKHFTSFKRTNDPLSFMMCDIDYFKRFNDDWGHLVGDQVLRLVGDALRTSFKGKDVVARYGGEEFAIVLPETPLNAACGIAEQIRRTIMAKLVRNKATGTEMGHVTLSIGVAGAAPSDSAESLIARADECLYEAKNSGRNRVVSQQE
jgi:diguanylate cyclase